VSFDRRELLGAFGVASASTLLWTLGCGGRPPMVRRAPQVSGEVRTWLHDAVARLAAVYPAVHALAVSRHRTTAALDVVGAGLARERHDGVVLTVRDRGGARREHMTSELTAAGIDDAVAALGASRRRASIDFGRAPDVPAESPPLDDHDLRHRVELLQRDATPSSRIVYAAAFIDVDDAVVWSVAPGHDRAQHLTRIRQSATRAAWNGARPVIGEAERAWSGWLDDRPLSADELAAASATALELMTPGGFDDGERTIVLDPSVVAVILDAAVRGRLTAAALTALAPASALGAPSPAPTSAPRNSPSPAPTGGPRDPSILGSALVTLVDDPTATGAYGGFAFDDEGEPAAPLTLLDAGRIAARLTDHAGGGAGRGRRPGHLAPVEPAPSHLQLVPGSAPIASLYSDGLILEGGITAHYDPASDRLRVACARARVLKAGSPTGLVYADVELAGTLTGLLTAVDGIASAPASFVPRAPGVAAADRLPLWRSISAPAVRSRGLVRARRSRA
jgi:predicted Zn-dependent protease